MPARRARAPTVPVWRRARPARFFLRVHPGRTGARARPPRREGGPRPAFSERAPRVTRRDARTFVLPPLGDSEPEDCTGRAPAAPPAPNNKNNVLRSDATARAADCPVRSAVGRLLPPAADARMPRNIKRPRRNRHGRVRLRVTGSRARLGVHAVPCGGSAAAGAQAPSAAWRRRGKGG